MANVTPGNILISPDGHATLIDLSFARRPDEGGSAANRPIMGTYRYIAPSTLPRPWRPTSVATSTALGCAVRDAYGSPRVSGQ